MNAHSSARSMLAALSAGSRFVGDISAVNAAMETCLKRDRACDARDGALALIPEPSNATRRI